MKNMFAVTEVEEVKARLGRLAPESERQWGKMSVAQMVAHCSLGVAQAVGDSVPKRLYLGRMIGGIIKPMVLREDAPMRRNSTTTLVLADVRDLGTERERLCGLIDRFAAGGATGCTRHPHSYFGRMTPEEWAILMYKHLDHHLRQFGV